MRNTRDRGERVDRFYGCLVIPVEYSIHKFHQGIVAHIGEFFQNAQTRSSHGSSAPSRTVVRVKWIEFVAPIFQACGLH